MTYILVFLMFSSVIIAQELPESVVTDEKPIVPTVPDFRLPDEDVSLLPLLTIPQIPEQKVHILNFDISKTTVSNGFVYEPFSAQDMVSPLTLGLGKSNPLLGQILTVASTAAVGVLAYQHISKYGFYSRKKLESK